MNADGSHPMLLDGKQMLLYRICFDACSPNGGIYLTDTASSYRRFFTQGFGPDWNPTRKPKVRLRVYRCCTPMSKAASDA